MPPPRRLDDNVSDTEVTTVRSSKALKQEFVRCVDENDSDISKELRKMMRAYIAKHDRKRHGAA